MAQNDLHQNGLLKVSPAEGLGKRNPPFLLVGM